MAKGSAGYTLLEMIVVMAIIAMATAVAAPPSYRMIRSWQEATQVADVLQQLERLPTYVRNTGQPVQGQAADLVDAVTLPDQWTLHFEPMLSVQANGVCTDNRATLTTAYQTIELEMQAPFCKVRRVDL